MKSSTSIIAMSLATVFLALATIGILNFANKRIDLWFIEYYNTVEELGFYGLAAQLTGMVITFVLPATFVISPYLTKATPERREKLLSRFSRFISSFGVFSILFVFATAWFIVPLVFGAEFYSSVHPLQVLTIGTMLLVFRNVFSIYNLSQKQLRPNLIASFLAFIATIFFDFLWIPKYGIMGAAYASVIAYGVSCIYVFISVYKEFNLGVFDYILINKSDFQFITHKAKTILNSKR